MWHEANARALVAEAAARELLAALRSIVEARPGWRAAAEEALAAISTNTPA
jgi:hypothetical protein